MKFYEIWIFQLLMKYIFILAQNQGVITIRFETFRYHFPFLYLDEQYKMSRVIDGFCSRHVYTRIYGRD